MRIVATNVVACAAAAAAFAASLVGVGTASAYSASIDTEGGFNGKYGTGCTYTITARGSDATTITITDNGTLLAVLWPSVTGDVRTNWKPTTTGVHVLTAQQSGHGPVGVKRTVGTGLNLGSSCPVL